MKLQVIQGKTEELYQNWMGKNEGLMRKMVIIGK